MEILKIKVRPQTNDLSLSLLKQSTFFFTNKFKAMKKANELIDLGWSNVLINTDTYINEVCIENKHERFNGKETEVYSLVDYRVKEIPIKKLTKNEKIKMFFDL